MEHPVRVAFCPILFAANGGAFDTLGRPSLPEDYEENEQFVVGKCDTPYDCGTCPFMHQWIAAREAEGWKVGWECDSCVKRDLPAGKINYDKSRRFLPGFYQSSRYWESMEGRDDVQPGAGIEGCTSCGWGSPVLQLILRK